MKRYKVWFSNGIICEVETEDEEKLANDKSIDTYEEIEDKNNS